MSYRPHLFPVSVKGVIVQAGKVVLLHNERDEWELPGGKLELGEEPPDRLRTEIEEETGWQAEIGPILDSWQYHVREGVDVLIVTYGAFTHTTEPPRVSAEHRQIGLFTPGEVEGLTMPAQYKRSIADWFSRLPDLVS